MGAAISTINRALIISADLVISVNGGCFLCTPVSLQQKQVRAVNRQNLHFFCHIAQILELLSVILTLLSE